MNQHSSEQPRKRLPKVNLGVILAAATVVLFAAGLLPGRTATAPSAEPVDRQAGRTYTADCQVLQHLTYEPCGHSITRREPLPDALRRADRAALEAAYADWRITSCAETAIEMSRQLPLYCPQHTVLQPDESGMLCIWQNTYGDAMSLVRELSIPLSDFPDDVQLQLRAGIPFATTAELAQWLESAES